MVDVPKLLAAVENLVWKRGLVTGSAVTHRVQADGSHVVTIVVPVNLVDQDKLLKPKASGRMPLGASTPDISKGR
jgi:hypothetical protein